MGVRWKWRLRYAYNWQDNGWRIPIGLRLGKAFIGETTTWNTYVEYASNAAWPNWNGPIAEHSIRIIVQFQIPLSL